MASRCGGEHSENWLQWCRSECVPEYARQVPCADNSACVLCDAPQPDDHITHFGLPAEEVEFLWTQLLPRDAPESIHPATEPAPTGGSFDDRVWEPGARIGAWTPFQPYDASLDDVLPLFCEPGPSLYLARNLEPTGSSVVMNAVRLSEAQSVLRCPGNMCNSGPYVACDETPTTQCQYRDLPDAAGLGTASQMDRTLPTGEIATYGYGSYRAILAASSNAIEPRSGTVYAFFSQSNAPCVDGETNRETNTAEIDVEISSSSEGSSGGMPFCTEDELCFITSTWTSSTQGIGDFSGRDRHQVTGFRFRDRADAGRAHTFGYDWRERDVRFSYDPNPEDCDEASGECRVDRGSLAICEHTHFVPRRPSPLHFQLWPAWWAGENNPGEASAMTVWRVWHEARP